MPVWSMSCGDSLMISATMHNASVDLSEVNYRDAIGASVECDNYPDRDSVNCC